MYKRILVAYDGSAPAEKAFGTALDLAQTHGSELYVLAVCRPLEVADEVENEAVIEDSLDRMRRVLVPLEQVVRDRHVKAHFEAAIGHPAEQIIFHADRIPADLIVVGHRGRSRYARLLLGSVAKHVVEYSDRQVLVVR